jgi:hypothetical protein
MTTQPTTSNDDWHLSSEFNIKHNPLYGILVTEKSFLIGTRSQALKHHAHFISHRIAGKGLPPELCDEIGEHLLTLLQNDATQLWERMEHDPAAREARFRLGRYSFNTEPKLALERFYKRIAHCETAAGTVKIEGSGVYVDVLDGAGSEEHRYVHLSASLVRPSVSLVVPGEVACSGGPQLSFRDGRVNASNRQGGATPLLRDEVRVFMSAGAGVGKANRLVQYDDVDTSIRSWNQQLIETFVLELGLKVICVRGDEGLGSGTQPKFRMLQRLTWSTRWSS